MAWCLGVVGAATTAVRAMPAAARLARAPGAVRTAATLARGFSLIEIVVVLLLLGIAAAVTAPALARLDERDPVGDGAERVRGVLRGARLAAVERGRPVVVVIVPEEARYRAWLAGDEARPLAEAALELADGVRLEATEPRPTFVFSPRGPAHGPALSVRRGARAATVAVDPWTGAARVRAP